MKRKTKFIILAILVVTVIGCMMAVFAGGGAPDLRKPTVTFDVSKWNSNDESVNAFSTSAVPYDDNNNPDLFPGLKEVMPGDSLETGFDLEVKNFTDKTQNVKIYLTAEWNSDFNNGYLKPEDAEGAGEVEAPAYNDDYAALMNSFMGMITVTTADGTQYAGTLEPLKSSENEEKASLIPEGTVLLGEFQSEGSTPVKVSFNFDANAQNDYSGLMAELGWKFTAEVVNKKPEKNSNPEPELNTDDHFAYIVGYPDGLVRPDASITRAEAVTIFFRLLTEESRDIYWSSSNSFVDVDSSEWYNNAVSTLTNAGIISGYPDGTFQPNNPISRAEMAKIISLFAKLDKTGGEFSDIADHWAAEYIGLAAGNEWINGYPDGTFKPDQQITRAETVTMVNRVLMRVPVDESRILSPENMQTYPDNISGEWYYIAVQEATNSHNYQRVSKADESDEQWTERRDNFDWTQLEK